MSEYTPGLWWHTWGNVWTDIAVMAKTDVAYWKMRLGMRAKYGLRPDYFRRGLRRSKLGAKK